MACETFDDNETLVPDELAKVLIVITIPKFSLTAAVVPLVALVPAMIVPLPRNPAIVELKVPTVMGIPT